MAYAALTILDALQAALAAVDGVDRVLRGRADFVRPQAGVTVFLMPTALAHGNAGVRRLTVELAIAGVNQSAAADETVLGLVAEIEAVLDSEAEAAMGASITFGEWFIPALVRQGAAALVGAVIELTLDFVGPLKTA
ncbi:MAG: hypothetical protein GX591_20520 [Planctomycetes bacterium]|nr:hypothetical protein [Planctomycetota bacterium]